MKTEPPATIPDVAPMARTFTFSRSVEPREARTFTKRTEAPTARIEIGIADSIPCPSFSAMYVAAAEKTTDQKNPWTIDRGVTSGTEAPDGMTGTYVSPGASSRKALSGRRTSSGTEASFGSAIRG